eukprot:1704057-Rhodomonas_salina.3
MFALISPLFTKLSVYGVEMCGDHSGGAFVLQSASCVSSDATQCSARGADSCAIVSAAGDLCNCPVDSNTQPGQQSPPC